MLTFWWPPTPYAPRVVTLGGIVSQDLGFSSHGCQNVCDGVGALIVGVLKKRQGECVKRKLKMGPNGPWNLRLEALKPLFKRKPSCQS